MTMQEILDKLKEIKNNTKEMMSDASDTREVETN